MHKLSMPITIIVYARGENVHTQVTPPDTEQHSCVF